MVNAHNEELWAFKWTTTSSLRKNYLIGELLRELDGLFSLSESYKNILEYGLDTDYFKIYFNTIKEITADEILLLAQRYLRVSDLSELIVGKNE